MITPDAERQALKARLQKLGRQWDNRILSFAAKGRSAKRIAAELGLDLKTVKTIFQANGLPHDD